jgi:hypothetical protein
MIELPYYFVFVPASQTVHLTRTKFFTIWYSYTSAFAHSLPGQIITNAVNVLRDLVVLIIEIVLNAISLVLLKKYLNRKMRLQGMTSRSLGADGTTASTAASQQRGDHISKADQRATLMAILMCLFSVIDHVLMITQILYPYFNFDLTVFVLYFLGGVFQPVKCCLDFGVFFFFNKNFRKVCKKSFGFD